MLDGSLGYNTYRCADGHFVSVGALEPRFYRILLEKLGLTEELANVKQNDPDSWPHWRNRFAALFATRTRDEWCALLEGTDACFAPVLNPDEAAAHPHMAERQAYSKIDGVLQANPAPRMSKTPAHIGSIPGRGEHKEAVLKDWLQDR
jgi:acetyl-CoA hydrolase